MVSWSSSHFPLSNFRPLPVGTPRDSLPWGFPGDVAFLGMMDSTTTVASLKEKLQETTAIQVGWQVLLLGGKGGCFATGGNRSVQIRWVFCLVEVVNHMNAWLFIYI